jgi:hypothetical protein
MNPLIILGAAMYYLYAKGNRMEQPCEERIVVAIERAGVDVSETSTSGIVTVADAARAIEHIAECWRDEAGRAVTRGRDAKRWEAKARALEQDVAAAKARHSDLAETLGKRTRELETRTAEAIAKIAEQAAIITSQAATIEGGRHERVELERQLAKATARRRRR